MIFFGVVGFLMKKFEYDSAPLVLAFILGPMFEEHFRRSLVLSFGSFRIFFERPISAVFLALAVLLLFFAVLPAFKRRAKG
jgi:putative tricarboxylic transport membrane protein